MPGYECVNSSAVTIWVSLQDHPEECPLPEQGLWVLTPTTCKVAIGAAPLVIMAPQDVVLKMVFVVSFFKVLWKKSSNHTQGAGGSLLLKQLFLPSERCVEGYTCIRAFKIPLVSLDTSTGFIFYLHPLKPEHGNNKTV